MRKKLSERQILDYLTDYLILNLNELQSLKTLSVFNEGEYLAYLECVEILSKWKHFKQYGITDIESYFKVT